MPTPPNRSTVDAALDPAEPGPGDALGTSAPRGRADPEIALTCEMTGAKTRRGQLAACVGRGEVERAMYTAKQATARWFAARVAYRRLAEQRPDSPITKAGARELQALRVGLLRTFEDVRRALPALQRFLDDLSGDITRAPLVESSERQAD